MPSLTKIILSAALALVACSTMTSALPAYDTNVLAARDVGALPRSLAEKILRKRLAKQKRYAMLATPPASNNKFARNLVERGNNGNGPNPSKGNAPDTGNLSGKTTKPGNPSPGQQGPPSPKPNDEQNCGAVGRVCPSSYNGVGFPKCKQGICTLQCTGGTRQQITGGGLAFCA